MRRAKSFVSLELTEILRQNAIRQESPELKSSNASSQRMASKEEWVVMNPFRHLSGFFAGLAVALGLFLLLTLDFRERVSSAFPYSFVCFGLRVPGGY